jgi:polyisoprenoid-binding protein YceI
MSTQAAPLRTIQIRSLTICIKPDARNNRLIHFQFTSQIRRSSQMKRVFCIAFLALAAMGFFVGKRSGAVGPTLSEEFSTAAQTGDSGVYNFDRAHSFIGFKVNHNTLIEVPGFFRDFTGAITYDNKDVRKSSVTFTAKVTSIDTGVQGRDNHLRTADFFDVATHPEFNFKSTKVEKKGKGWLVTGDLTMKGITKSISFPFDIPGFLPANERNGGRMGVTAETVINRRDFSVNYDSKLPNGKQVVSDEVKVVLQIEAVKPKEAPKAE